MFDIGVFIVGVYLGFWQIRNGITFVSRNQYGKIRWAFEKFSIPMPKQGTIADSRKRNKIGIVFILLGVLLIIIPLNILLGLGIGFLCGGLWELVISLIEIVNVEDEVVKKKYFDNSHFTNNNFHEFCLELKKSLSSNKWVYTIQLNDGIEFMGLPAVHLYPFNMLMFYNSEKKLFLILFHFNSSMQYFIYDGYNLILKDIIDRFVLIKNSDYSELRYP